MWQRLGDGSLGRGDNMSLKPMTRAPTPLCQVADQRCLLQPLKGPSPDCGKK